MKLGTSLLLLVCLVAALGTRPDAAPQARAAQRTGRTQTTQVAPVASHPPSRDALRRTGADAADYRALLDKYCVTCHNQRTKTADLTLDTSDLNDVPAGADV